MRRGCVSPVRAIFDLIFALAQPGIILLEKIQIDDVVSAIPVHLASGIWGTLAVAIFGNFEQMGIEKTKIEQLTIQLIGILSIGSFCFFEKFIKRVLF